ncbi:MAG: hypothetical protein D6712_11465 [Chloroflexi bacterium]|nr:MAG: hypothetical protein D6712_11465 [Chloroflexota bacterium]
MAQQLKNIVLQVIRLPRRILGSSVELEPLEAIPADVLTPREALIEQTARIIRRALWVHWFITLGLLLAGAMAGIAGQPQLMELAHQLFLGAFVGPDDVALALIITLMLIDMAALLILLVGVRGQEFWVIGAAPILAVLNLGALVLLGFTPGLLTFAFSIWVLVFALRDWRAFRLNPVMMKELRGRMRGARAFVVMGVYLGLMSLFTVLVYAAYPNITRYSGPVLATGELGRVLFNTVIGIEMVLIMFIVPAFTSGAITGERERKTYDLLRTTLLPEPSFIVGKLESALSYVLLLLLAAIPIQSIAFLFGGVGESELIIASIILGVTAFVLGALGLFLSSTTERTLTANVRAYLVALFVTFVLPALLVYFIGVYQDALTGFAGITASTSYSPVVETLLIYLGLFIASVNPISAWVFSQMMLVDHQSALITTVTLASNGTQVPVVAPWVLYGIIYTILAAVLLIWAMRRMRRMRLD